MKKLTLLVILFTPLWANAVKPAKTSKLEQSFNSREFETPECYRNVPVQCGFDEMLLAMCNVLRYDGAFDINEKRYIPGGDLFVRRVEGKTEICEVTPVSKNDNPNYKVTIHLY